MCFSCRFEYLRSFCAISGSLISEKKYNSNEIFFTVCFSSRSGCNKICCKTLKIYKSSNNCINCLTINYIISAPRTSFLLNDKLNILALLLIRM